MDIRAEKTNCETHFFKSLKCRGMELSFGSWCLTCSRMEIFFFKKKKTNTTKTFIIRVSLGKRQVILFPHNRLVGELWDDSVFLSGELLTLCFLCRLLINQWVSKSIGYLPLQVMNTACLCELIFQRGKKIELTLLCLASTHVYNFILLKLCESFICG